jgi:hypothetical protein
MSGSQLPEVRTVGQEAEAILGPGIFQSEEIFFSTRPRTTRARAKAARALIPVLKQALEPGEKVRFLSASGYTYHVWEHMFGAGAWAIYVNGATLVTTDHRLLLFNVKHRSRSPKDIKNAISLSDIKSVRRFAGNLTLRLRDNTKVRVAALPFADARELRSRLQREIENPMRSLTPLVSGMGLLQHLCPACCKPVANVNALQCTSCRSEFRSGRTAALRSLLLPGLGDIYLKHTVLGTLELIGSVMLWLVFLNVLFFGDGGAIISVFLLLAIANGTDYFVTQAMARKGIVAK